MCWTCRISKRFDFGGFHSRPQSIIDNWSPNQTGRCVADVKSFVMNETAIELVLLHLVLKTTHFDCAHTHIQTRARHVTWSSYCTLPVVLYRVTMLKYTVADGEGRAMEIEDGSSTNLISRLNVCIKSCESYGHFWTDYFVLFCSVNNITSLKDFAHCTILDCSSTFQTQ